MKKKILVIVYTVLITVSLLQVIQIPYIVKYNSGNNAYKKRNYEKAITEYESALKLFPPKYEECKIRINLSLSMIKTIKQGDSRKIALKTLEEARNVLIEDGCAHDKDDEGHSSEAEKLKKDIDRMIEEIQSQNNEENEGNSEEDEANEKLEKLEKIQEQSYKERQSKLEDTEELYKAKYYSGKNW